MRTDPRDIIMSIRDQKSIEEEALRDWVIRMGQPKSDITDSQCAAFAMAVLCQGLGDDLRGALTLAMRDSGNVLRWGDGGPVVDKHSTGGIGDSTSFIIAPILAALGARVPMISGRGLGHTGGTLDKIEAFAGVQVDQDQDTFQGIVNDVGCAIVSAGPDLAPSDRRLYRLRDHVGAVPSVDLVTSSILSKKLAEGISTLVLDVKFGSGGFVPTAAAALELAQIMCATGQSAGVKTQALVTDMNAPLASAIGHATELRAVAEILTAKDKGSDLYTLSVALCAQLLVAAEMSPNVQKAKADVVHALTSGAALEKFEAMIVAQGGPHQAVRDIAQTLPMAPVITEIFSPQDGFVAEVDGPSLAQVIYDLGGMRHGPDDKIDLSVGFEKIAPRGAARQQGQPLCEIHSQSALSEEQLKRIQAAFFIADEAPSYALIFDQVV